MRLLKLCALLGAVTLTTSYQSEASLPTAEPRNLKQVNSAEQTPESLSSTGADDKAFKYGYETIHRMTGCFLVDFSYTETKGLKEGYHRDDRVYDANKNKAIKEWIYTEDLSPTRVRLQHVLFEMSLDGKEMLGILKHEAEDWEYRAKFLYEFIRPFEWRVKDLQSPSVNGAESGGLWTRRITNLDDGLRYQCASNWREDTFYPEWSCDAYAPIPGREYRDMHRSDYNTLQRRTKLVVYSGSWLERQNNTKIIHQTKYINTDDVGEEQLQQDAKVPLAEELGKNWYTKLPDEECKLAREYIHPRRPFWNVLREAWEQVLIGDTSFVEKIPPKSPPRFVKMYEIESKFRRQDLQNQTVRDSAMKAIRQVIDEYRQQQQGVGLPSVSKTAASSVLTQIQ